MSRVRGLKLVYEKQHRRKERKSRLTPKYIKFSLFSPPSSYSLAAPFAKPKEQLCSVLPMIFRYARKHLSALTIHTQSTDTANSAQNGQATEKTSQKSSIASLIAFIIIELFLTRFANRTSHRGIEKRSKKIWL